MKKMKKKNNNISTTGCNANASLGSNSYGTKT